MQTLRRTKTNREEETVNTKLNSRTLLSYINHNDAKMQTQYHLGLQLDGDKVF